MKQKISLKRLVLFAIIAVGVLLLADSLWVALAALVLLFVADALLGVWGEKRFYKHDDDNDKSE